MLYNPVNNFLVMPEHIPGLNQLLAKDKVSGSRTQHNASGVSNLQHFILEISDVGLQGRIQIFLSRGQVQLTKKSDFFSPQLI